MSLLASLERLAADPPPAEPESDADAHARHLATLKRMAELGMAMAEDAATRHAAAPPDSAEKSEATLTFARATHVVRQAIAHERRARAPQSRHQSRNNESGNTESGPRESLFAPHDPRRAQLRQLLYKASEAEPDRAIRAATRRRIDEHIEDALRADPDRKRPVVEPLKIISRVFGYPVDVSKLSDEIIGMPPRPRYPEQHPGQPGPEPPETS